MLEFLFFAVVTVAQLVESRIVIPVVVGSSPIGHPTIYAGFQPPEETLNGDKKPKW